MQPLESFMRQAIGLALRGRGRVEPNPMVGAVLVREGRVVGKGLHERFGGAHAEVNALDQAGEAARGADLYVTLDPCCRHGKQPPCVDAILAAGVGRAIIGAADPTQGEAAGILRRGGVEVIQGFLRDECDAVVAPFIKLRTRGRPWVTAKWAMTADGRIATRTGDSRWISGPASRRKAHELRALSDAIIIGVGTALADDPLLTCRIPGGRNPMRVALDRQARLPLESRLVRTTDEAPVCVFVKRPPEARARALRAAGCEVIDLAERDEEPDFDAALAALGERDITHALVEGGARVLAAAFQARSVDEVRVFIAPKIVGGDDAPGPVAGAGVELMAGAIALTSPRWSVIDGDALLEARVAYPGRTRRT